MISDEERRWLGIARAALIGAKHALRDAADSVADKAKTHAAADYIEAVLDQAPSPPTPWSGDASARVGPRPG